MIPFPASVADQDTRFRLLLVAENISLTQSGETSIPYYYLEGFLRRQIGVQAICHARVREELRRDLPAEVFNRVTFIEDSPVQKMVFALGKVFHYRIEDLVFGQIIHVITQVRMRGIAKRLIRAHRIDLVFQPVPISPKALSFMFGFKVPVVIGPMCGGLELPPAFASIDGGLVTWSIERSRALANLMHRVIPGKRDAAALIVGNKRTEKALPNGMRGAVYEVVESGVDLGRWAPKLYPIDGRGKKVRFVFCGRLVDWKGAQYLVKAFAPLARRGGVALDLIGDGELYEDIERQVAAEGIADSVVLHGRVPLERCIALMTAGDVYVMPSLRECGGLALLEAMALGLPIVATNWMGPAEYLNDSCAILVAPDSERAMVSGFSAAMIKLADAPALRRSLGEAARKRVSDGYYSWQNKVDRIVEILVDVLKQAPGRQSTRGFLNKGYEEPGRTECQRRRST